MKEAALGIEKFAFACGAKWLLKFVLSIIPLLLQSSHVNNTETSIFLIKATLLLKS